MRSNRLFVCLLLIHCLCLTQDADVLAQGVVLPGVGAVNRSMAGASVAAPIDGAGAMHWNPAAISGLAENEMMFSAEFLYPRTDLSSRLPANSFGAGLPSVDLEGSNSSHSGVAVLPTSALVYRPECSACTYGLGVYGIGGFGANYDGSTTNPILTAQPPNGFGAGNAFSRVNILQIAPTIAFDLTDRLSFGFAPTVDVADLAVDPGYFAAPDNANGDGFSTYPSATHSRLHWGLGFQLGVYYEANNCWNLGASFKSPQWFETFSFMSADELGAPRRLSLNIDYPMIVSLGAAYRGFDRFLWAIDTRFIDYKNTDGLGDNTGFDASGATTGLGWKSVFSLATGAQYQASSSVSLRLGYLYNTNPVRDRDAFFNIVSAPIYQHAIFTGASLRMTSRLGLSLAYLHAFENSIEGPYQTALGSIPGSSIKSSQVTDSLVMSLHAFL